MASHSTPSLLLSRPGGPSGAARACRTALSVLIATLLLPLFAGPAAAQMAVQDQCMEEIAAKNLVCTANDVRIASASNIVILDDGCLYPGDTVTFSATFEVLLTAQARHDIGIWFATDGDPNGDGAFTGACTIATLPIAPDPPFCDLDGVWDDPKGLTQDLCGDIDAGHNPIYEDVTLTAVCVDQDNDGFLNLPNCTSWRQPGSNELCLSPLDAYPGAPSKCRCDIGFNIAVDVPPAELEVTKTADRASVPEPGGFVGFAVTVENIGVDPSNSVDLTALTDTVFGDLLDPTNLLVSNNTCLALDLDLGPGETEACSFDAWVTGNGGDVHEDEVTAAGYDQRSPPNYLEDTATASVAIADVAPGISVVKTATPDAVLEPGDTVSFQVTVHNTSLASSDPITVTSLVDDIHGDLHGLGSCSVPQTVAPGAAYTCVFDAFVAGNAGEAEVDVVTADAVDDEGNPVSASDAATVDIDDVPSLIGITKTAAPTTVYEPGGWVTFTFTVENLSKADLVTIDSLIDDVHGDLDGRGDCSVPQLLPVGGLYICSSSMWVAGDGNTAETDVATASGFDDDGNPVNDSDDATVTVANVPPAASLTKAAVGALVTFEVTVVNDSAAEALTLDALNDDVFGDVTQIQGAVVQTTCSVPQLLARSGQPGDSYSCSFEADIASSPHSDTVTGTVWDNEGGFVMPSDSASVSFE